MEDLEGPTKKSIARGKSERYLKDDLEEASYMMQIALNEAALIPQADALPIGGDALAELVRQYNTANAIIMRLTRAIDAAALTAIMTGVTLDLNTIEAAGARPVSLGRLVLRVETAAIYCLSVLNYELQS